MGNGLLAFTAGLGGGYLQAQQRNRDQERQDTQDSQNKQLFDARMDDVNREKKVRAGLAEASAPATMTEDKSWVLPDGEQGPSLSQYQVKGQGLDQTFTDKAQAQKSLADYITPDAVVKRQAGVYRANSLPEKGLTLENAALTQKRAEEQYTKEQQDHARKLQEEGVFQAMRSFRAGDASGITKAFNANGQYKLDGDPVVTKEDREVPGIGTIPTYTAKMRMVGPDGQVQEKVYNSHDLSMQMMPYEKALELQRKGTDSDNKANYQGALIDAKSAALEAKTAAAAAKSSGQPSREERLRYTSLFTDAGRRMGESQRALSSLQKDPLFMMNARKSGSPESQQLQDLRDSIKSHGDERSMYQGLLAGSQTAGLSDSKPNSEPKQEAPGLGNPRTKTTTPADAKPDFSNLWK